MMSQTYGGKSKRYIIQRDEWLRSLQIKLTPIVEKMLREFYQAAVIANQKRPDLTLEYCFMRLIEMSRGWEEDKVVEVMGEHNSTDAGICLQQVVKCHATVLALSTATPCRVQLEVPSIFKFFRTIIDATVSDLSEMRAYKEGNISVFGTSDTAQRKRTRTWIDQIVADKCLIIVPVGMFAHGAPVEKVADFGTPPKADIEEVVLKEEKSTVEAAPPTAAAPVEEILKEEKPKVEPVPLAPLEEAKPVKIDSAAAAEVAAVTEAPIEVKLPKGPDVKKAIEEERISDTESRGEESEEEEDDEDGDGEEEEDGDGEEEDGDEQ